MRTGMFPSRAPGVRAPRAPACLAVLALLVGGLLSACDAFSFYEQLDGAEGAALEISPLSATLPVGGAVSFTVRGGFPPHSVAATAGSVSQSPSDPSVWSYTAPAQTGTSTVTAGDSRGNRRSASVTVILVGPLFLTPQELSVEVGHSAVLTAVGGSPHPSTGYSFSSSGGTLTRLSASQVRLSGLSDPGTITVSAGDELGSTSHSVVSVLTTVALAISPSSTTMVAGRTLSFSAYGGQPPYSFSTTAGASYLSPVSATEVQFTAPAQTGSYTVTVTDAALDSQSAGVTVEAPSALAISPSSITLHTNQRVTFEAFGGVGPGYSFDRIAGVGTIVGTGPSTAEYTAPSSAGTATIRVSDSDIPAGTNTASVTVQAPLAISPVAVTVTAGRSFAFSATGGDPGTYSYSVVSGGGSFSGGTYTAPLVPGSATVRVSDGSGNRSEAAVTISALGPLTITPTAVTLRRSDSITFQASGGISPYSYSIVAGPGTIVPASGVYTADDRSGTTTVRVTDSAVPANMSDATVEVIWIIDTIHSAGEAGKYPSLALDGSGNPHVSYWVESAGELWYARWNGSGWTAGVVDGTADVGEHSSLALDSAGRPHISYYDDTNKRLKYARWDGSAWAVQTVPGSGEEGKHSSLALDSADRPHICYYDTSSKDLEYARWDGAAWVVVTVDGGGDVGEYASLGLDSNDYPQVAYYDETNKDLKCARWNGTSWNIETVDGFFGSDRGKYCSLKVDSGDCPAAPDDCRSPAFEPVFLHPRVGGLRSRGKT